MDPTKEDLKKETEKWLSKLKKERPFMAMIIEDI